jgi:Lon protease-like protein
MREVGLFPLSVVLLPMERLPLHIFEPRYKELIGECLETGRPFGLVLADEENMREVGTLALVTDVIERFDDGRLNIAVEGDGRFRILQRTGGRSFLTAEIDEYEDTGGPASDEEIQRCVTAYSRVVSAIDGDDEESHDALDPNDPGLAFRIAARIEFGAEVRQDLLEEQDESARLARLTELLERAAGAIELQKRARERAQHNGLVERL